MLTDCRLQETLYLTSVVPLLENLPSAYRFCEVSFFYTMLHHPKWCVKKVAMSLSIYRIFLVSLFLSFLASCSSQTETLTDAGPGFVAADAIHVSDATEMPKLGCYCNIVNGASNIKLACGERLCQENGDGIQCTREEKIVTDSEICGCTSTTCVAKGANCGTIFDGCGSTVQCGTCSANSRNTGKLSCHLSSSFLARKS